MKTKRGLLSSPVLRLAAPAPPSKSRPSSMLLRRIMFLIGFPAPPFDNDDVTVAVAVADAPPAGADTYEGHIGTGLGDADSRISLRSESGVGMTVDLTRSLSNDVGSDDEADTAVVPVRFFKKLKTRCVGFRLLLSW